MDQLIETHRQQIIELARRRGAKRIKVFGSMATNRANETSDVDFLVEMKSGQSAFALGGLLKDLEELLGRRVDMTTPNALHPAIRSSILREAIDL
ncbi:nucleotidyltransferase family protein [Trichloromonas sp.]|uniref:nucleotidyltransferase family protein n=1 Tax=Trichloromonas sp. TaxID=3069249 RepID=UPI003D813C2F